MINIKKQSLNKLTKFFVKKIYIYERIVFAPNP